MADPPCPVCGYDSSLVTPPDAEVAMRSYVRRFRELFGVAQQYFPQFGRAVKLDAVG